MDKLSNSVNNLKDIEQLEKSYSRYKRFGCSQVKIDSISKEDMDSLKAQVNYTKQWNGITQNAMIFNSFGREIEEEENVKCMLRQMRKRPRILHNER